MIVTFLFALLAVLALLGAVGLLVFRRVLHCAYAFLVFCVASAGLYLLLNMSFLALVQLFIVFLVITLIAVGTTSLRQQPTVVGCTTLGFLPVAALLLVTAVWAINRGTLGEPVLQSMPMWAVRTERIVAFGQALVDHYLILVGLTGLLLLVSIVSISHVARPSRQVSNSDELDRQRLS